MENKTISYKDIQKQFETYLDIVNRIPFGFFYDNEEICPDKFAVLFDYLKPTLPLLSYVTMLRTENPDVTAPNYGNFAFFACKTSLDNLKVIKFNTWIGYYSEMITSFDKDLTVSLNSLKNYNLMYKYIVRLKNCVRVIDDFFLIFDRNTDYLAPIYKDIAGKNMKTLIRLKGYFGNCISSKNGWIEPFQNRHDRIDIRTPDTHNIIYNPFTIENQNLPCHADLNAVRGGTGTNFLATIP